jgi:hypothetical protein
MEIADYAFHAGIEACCLSWVTANDAHSCAFREELGNKFRANISGSTGN